MLKIEKDLEKVTDPVIIQIAKYLIDKCEVDAHITVSLNKANKSLAELEKYIDQEVRKVARARKISGGAVHVEDPTVYGWAQYYYDDDSIVMSKPLVNKAKPKKVDEINLPDEELDDFDF